MVPVVRATVPRVQIEIQEPPDNWLVDLSKAHPDDEFRILATHPADEGIVGILEANSEDAESITEYLDEVELLRSYRVLDADEDVQLIEYRTPEPEVHSLVLESGTVPRYPVVFRDGTTVAHQTTSHEQVSELTTTLESAGIDYEIRFLVQTLTPGGLLTERQRQVVEEAIACGYYETPRRCSLTDLADELGVHKTTVSDVLHRAEGKIIAEFVASRT